MVTLLGAVGVTLIGLAFAASFIGALHDPGPRGVPVGIVGTSYDAASRSGTLRREASGGFTITSNPAEQAARKAILDPAADAALVPGPHAQPLLVASAAGAAVTQDTIKAFTSAAHRAGAADNPEHPPATAQRSPGPVPCLLRHPRLAAIALTMFIHPPALKTAAAAVEDPEAPARSTPEPGRASL